MLLTFHYIFSITFKSYVQEFFIYIGIFNKFTNEDNHFREDLVSDVRGILSLYEAAYLRTHGDDILEEALAFTTTHLKSMVDHLEYPLSKQVVRYLNRPIRKSLERLEARWYMSIYQDEDFHDKTLLKLAKLDFNLVQSLHKEELHNVSRLIFKSLVFISSLCHILQKFLTLYKYRLNYTNHVN